MERPLFLAGECDFDRLLDFRLAGDLLLKGDLILRIGDRDLLRSGGDLDLRRLGGGDLRRIIMGDRRGEGCLRLKGAGDRARGRRAGGLTGRTICTTTSCPSTHPPLRYFKAFLAFPGVSYST